MVRRVAWVGAILLTGVWTLLCLAADGLMGWASGIGAANADLFTGHPETVAGIAWAIELLGSLGTVVVVIAWLIGAALIFGSAALLLRLSGRGRPGLPAGSPF